MTLVAIGVLTWAATVAFAAQRRRTVQRDAADHYARGVTALHAGHLAAALEALRLASVRDRDSARYALQFARALIANGQRDAAERTLSQLRERSPDDPEVNLELARLAAAAGDVDVALRYYRYALYAPWPDAAHPVQVRRELVEFLLARQNYTRALSELIAARANTPEDAAARRDLGELFLRAGEPALALAEFRRSLALAPADPETTRLAGEAAFRIGDYAAAARDLGGPLTTPVDREMRSIALTVFSKDPLAPRIRSEERLERMEWMIEHAIQRAERCGLDAGTLEPSFRDVLRRSRGRDTDLLEQGVDAVYTLVQQANGCQSASTDDRALLIIGERHREPAR